MAYYRMDWGNGTTAYDYSGKVNNGSLINGPGWVEAYSWERGLVAHYTLDGSGYDIAGTNPGSVSGATSTSNRHGYDRTALSFDGNDLVEIESSLISLDQGAISTWFYYDPDTVTNSNEPYDPLFGSSLFLSRT